MGVYDWGLKVLCLCVNLTWDAEPMHFEGSSSLVCYQFAVQVRYRSPV